MSFIVVAEEEGVDPIEVPTEDDTNKSILLSTLTSLFPGASGLKYKNSETGAFRGIRLIGGRLQPPEEGWNTTDVYYCAFKDNKRKNRVQSETPNSKRNENKTQQKDSAKKRKLNEEERLRREEEKERERLKREALKEEERIRREALKEEERVRREEEKARKEAIKEEERIKREEEKARKDALKEEERVRKEEEKARREEERARKEALKEEEKQKESQKKEKQKNILRKFFIKKSFDESINRKNVTNIESTANGLFLPFELCENQSIAQIVPESAKKRFNRQELDRLLVTQDSTQLYFDLLKSVEYKPLSRNKVDKSEPEIIIESQTGNEENLPKRMKAKYLKFHENVRPPYRGTFRKKSSKLKATQPFNKDSDLFDYEVDSDEEWDEGGPGESLDGSDSDGSVKDDYEIDNEFFVPHGYLSDDENQNEDKAQEIIENETTNDQNEDQKEKCGPLVKEDVLMAERNRRFASNLMPIVLGCLWETNPKIIIN